MREEFECPGPLWGNTPGPIVYTLILRNGITSPPDYFYTHLTIMFFTGAQCCEACRAVRVERKGAWTQNTATVLLLLLCDKAMTMNYCDMK